MTMVNELVIERQSMRENAASPIKSILFVVHDDDDQDSRLQLALSLARSCSAHLQLLQIIPLEAYTVVDTYGGTFASGTIVEGLEEHASNVRNRLEDQLKNEDVSWSCEVTTAPLVAELLRMAAFSDLVVIGRKPRFREFTRNGPGLLGEFLCSTRTPLCVPGDEAKAFDPFGKAIIAWNGSIEGANAVRGSIGLLRMASEVLVVRYVEDDVQAFPDTHLLQYLSRHGIHAEIQTHLPRTEISNDLAGYAAGTHAQYIVMGGYSHSRAGEFLFGGVTRELLGSCRISLLMAH